MNIFCEKLTHFLSTDDQKVNYGGDGSVSWSVCSSRDQAVQVWAPVGDIMLCSRARHFTLTVPLSSWVYKWVLTNIMLGVTLRHKNTPSCFMLHQTGWASAWKATWLLCRLKNNSFCVILYLHWLAVDAYILVRVKERSLRIPREIKYRWTIPPKRHAGKNSSVSLLVLRVWYRREKQSYYGWTLCSLNEDTSWRTLYTRFYQYRVFQCNFLNFRRCNELNSA